MAVSVDSILYADVGQGADAKGPGYGFVLAVLDAGTYATGGVDLTAAVLSAALVAAGYAPIAAIRSVKIGLDDADGTYFGANASVTDGDATIEFFTSADADADAAEVADTTDLGAEAFTALITVSHRS